MPHNFGLSAVDTTPRLAPLTTPKSPEKSLLYRKRMNSVSERLLHNTEQHVSMGNLIAPV